MANDPKPPNEPGETQEAVADVEDSAAELERLRRLLLGREQDDLRQLEERLDAWNLTPEEVAEQLPEAIAIRSAQDDSLGRALAPTLEEGITESVSRNPHEIAQAIYPILGPAIRKAISETISGFVDTLNRAIEHSLSVRGLKWRLEAWRTGVPYGQIVLKHALVYQVEQVFLVHAESGLLLAHAALDESKSKDPDLVSGMLTAIRDFVGDSFEAQAEGGLRTFSVGDLTVKVAAGPRALLAAVVRGQPPAELRRRLEATLETIHLQMRTPLRDFEGDMEPFASTDPMLADLLETVVATDRSQTRSIAPRVAWAVATLVLLLLLGLTVRSWLLGRRAVRALRTEPGIALIEADPGLRRWKLTGLRDPLARDPAAVLSELGVDPERVDGSWEPYLSFDREMILARARRALDPPAGVDVTLHDGVLAVSGSASARWAAGAEGALAGVEGLSVVDRSRLRVTLPPDLAEIERRLEGRHVLFEVGSATLTRESLAQLDELAAELGHLAREADELDYGLSVAIIGRTDSSGTEETNRTLSAQRAQAVLDALIERGLVPDRASAQGVGVTDPLAGADEAETERINRSASFALTLSGPNDPQGGDR